MNEEQKARIKELATEWLKRTHLGRDQAERQAYAEGVEDTLTAIFEDTRHGLYPANATAQMLNTLLDL